MKILFFTIGTRIYPSSRTRVYGYLPYLEERYASFKLINFTSPRGVRNNILMKKRDLFIRVLEKFYNLKNTLKVILLSRRYDIIFLQKVLLPKIFFNIIKALNRRIIFDFDDAIYLANKKFRNRFIHTVKSSKAVITSNKFLGDEAKKYNNNVMIIPTSVDIDKYKLEHADKSKDKFVIVWIGTPAASRYLYLVKDVFMRLVREYQNSIRIKLIGLDEFTTGDAFTDRHIELVRWAEDTEAQAISLAHVGIMPLDYDEWSMGKAGYKLIQYMAGGLPVLSFANSVTEEIVDEGINGFLLTDNTGWFDKISFLMKDRTMVEKMGLAGRRKAEEAYSYKSNFRNFYKVLEECML